MAASVWKILDQPMYKVPPKASFYLDIWSNFSQNFWEGCIPAALMDGLPQQITYPHQTISREWIPNYHSLC
jgi:hypothetical protein